MDSFLRSIPSFLKIMPDFRPKGLSEQIVGKCKVLNFPIVYPSFHCPKCDQSYTDSSSSIFEDSRIIGCHGDVGCLNKNASKPIEVRDSGLSIYTGAREKIEAIDAVQKTGIDSDTTSKLLDTVQFDQSENTDKSTGKSDKSLTKSMQTEPSNKDKEDEIERKRSKLTESVEMASPLHIVWPHRW